MYDSDAHGVARLNATAVISPEHRRATYERHRV
jgi:hypothetical protein